MIKTTETTGLADSDNLKYFLRQIMNKDEGLFIVTHFHKGSSTNGNEVYLAFTDLRIMEFKLPTPILNEFTSYDLQQLPKVAKDAISKIEIAPYYNQSITGFTCETFTHNYITVSFIEDNELKTYIKETPFITTYMRYLKAYSDKAAGRA